MFDNVFTIKEGYLSIPGSFPGLWTQQYFHLDSITGMLLKCATSTPDQKGQFNAYVQVYDSVVEKTQKYRKYN